VIIGPILMPLLIALRVKNYPRTKPRFAISSLAKDEAKGTSGVTWAGPPPAAKGDPNDVSGVTAPLAPTCRHGVHRPRPDA
jgi:hypothetical protein